MILSSGLLLPLFFQLLASSAIADGYPLHPQNDIIRRSSYASDHDTLPQLQWRRCKIQEAENCRGLENGDSTGIDSPNLMARSLEEPLPRDCDDDDCKREIHLPRRTLSDPIATIPREGRETETPIPTTELMQATREHSLYVEDELNDDDEDIATIPTPVTTSRTHGTFLSRHTSSASSLQVESETLKGCGTGKWDYFFRNTSRNDFTRFITPQFVALGLLLLFLVAVIVVEVGEALWRLWNSGRFMGCMGSGCVRLTGPEKTLLAVPDNDPRVMDRDGSPAHDREKCDARIMSTWSGVEC